MSRHGFLGAAVVLVAVPVALRAQQPAGAASAPRAAPAAAAPALDPWNGRWSIADVSRDGQRMLVRRNTTAAAFAGGPRFPDRVSITVPLPRGADYTPAGEINRVETLLVEALEQEHKALAVLVLTTDSAREFVFYAADGAGAAAAVERLRADAAPYALQVHTAPDPAWERYASFAP